MDPERAISVYWEADKLHELSTKWTLHIQSETAVEQAQVVFVNMYNDDLWTWNEANSTISPAKNENLVIGCGTGPNDTLKLVAKGSEEQCLFKV